MQSLTQLQTRGKKKVCWGPEVVRIKHFKDMEMKNSLSVKVNKFDRMQQKLLSPKKANIIFGSTASVEIKYLKGNYVINCSINHWLIVIGICVALFKKIIHIFESIKMALCLWIGTRGRNIKYSTTTPPPKKMK